MVTWRWGASVAYLTAYVVASLLGRMAVLQGSGLALFWPAAGVAGLWMVHGATRRQVLLDAALLLLSTVALNLLLSGGLGPALLFGVANTVLGVTFRWVSAVLEGELFLGPMSRLLTGSRDLLDLGLAALAASVASAPVGLLAAYLASGTTSPDVTTAWVVRNACGCFVVAASVMAIMSTVVTRVDSGWRAVLNSERRHYWVVELVIAATVSTGTALAVFGSTQQAPIAFIMIASAVWIGYRFSPAVAGVHSGLFAVLAVLYTLAGLGPFGSMEDITRRAIVVQMFVLVTVVVELMLSLGVAERVRFLRRVVDSEGRARSRAELLDAVMNVMTDGLVVLEPSGEVMMRNRAAELLMGPRREPGQDGPDDYGIFRPDGTPFERDELPHVRALHAEVVNPEDVLRIDPGTGEQSILSVGALPLPRASSEGGPLAVVVIHDVTQERAHRRELQAFAGTVAHDLKAPLTGVGSWAEILGDQLDALGVDVTEPRSSLRRIEGSAERMRQLITDLLAYSQAQSATLAPVSLSLTGMVEHVARELREVDTGTPPLIEHGPLGVVLADRTLVTQLLSNVIGNAVKYVAPGTRPHVMISSGLVGDMVEVRVADNGIGIPRGERGRIFDSFYRASSSGSYPGTGLGLAICARAVQRHGGRISAREGLDGGGTTLVFTLPADLESDPDEVLEPHDPGRTTSADPPPRRTGSETAVR